MLSTFMTRRRILMRLPWIDQAITCLFLVRRYTLHPAFTSSPVCCALPQTWRKVAVKMSVLASL
jgi:hypothetical protein